MSCISHVQMTGSPGHHSWLGSLLSPTLLSLFPLAWQAITADDCSSRVLMVPSFCPEALLPSQAPYRLCFLSVYFLGGLLLRLGCLLFPWRLEVTDQPSIN